MLGETFTLGIRPAFVDELDRAVVYIEFHLCSLEDERTRNDSN